MKDVDLFGNEIDEFKTQKDKWGIWPITVWDCDMSDPGVKKIKEAIGDLDVSKPRGGETALGNALIPSAKRDNGRVMASAMTATRAFKNTEINKQLGRVLTGTPISIRKDTTKALVKSAREGCFTLPTLDESIYRGKCTISIFNPAVASWILNLYAPSSGICYDPFAGGGTRAIMAAKHGLKYHGCEIRQEEIEAVMERAKGCEVQNDIMLYHADARKFILQEPKADFLITCPPYYNLEQYDGGPDDLSMAKTYDHFLNMIFEVVKSSYHNLKAGAYSCWIVGLHRDEQGGLLPLHHDIARAHRIAGFKFKEEVILSQKNNGAIQRVGNFEKGNKRLIRTHEYLLVFVR